jgi:hypothetical protein
MNINEYVETLIKNFIRDITDHVFISIQSDEKLMCDYLTNVNRYGLNKLNEAIGMKIKTLLDLDDDGRNNKPKSHLIKIYTYHKIKEETYYGK